MTVFYLLFLWGVLELVIIVLVASAIGAMPTLGLLVLGSVIGSVILRQERQRFAARIQQSGGVSMNSADMKDGMFRVLGGTLLFMPGFISDVFAIICMVPALRGVFGGLLMKVFRPDIVVQRFGYAQRGGQVYEGEVKTESNAKPIDPDTPIKGEFIEHDQR